MCSQCIPKEIEQNSRKTTREKPRALTRALGSPKRHSTKAQERPQGNPKGFDQSSRKSSKRITSAAKSSSWSLFESHDCPLHHPHFHLALIIFHRRVLTDSPDPALQQAQLSSDTEHRGRCRRVSVLQVWPCQWPPWSGTCDRCAPPRYV